MTARRDKRTFRSYSPAFDNTASARRRVSHVFIGNVSAAITRDVFRAASEVLIKQISLVMSTAISTSNTNYWTFDVQNVTKGGASLFSTVPNTTTTSGTAVTADTNYDLTPDQNLYLTTNDVLQIVFTETLLATNLQNLLVVIDYEVSGITTTTSSSTTTTTTTTTSTSTTTTTTTTTTTSTTTTVT